VERYSGLIVGHAVLWNIDASSLAAVIVALPRADRYYSDGWKAYQAVEWPGLHEVSVGKRDTHTVEGRNSELRHYLARLRRKTKCYSKSVEALARAIKLFVYGWNRRQHRYLAEPKLKGTLCLLFLPIPSGDAPGDRCLERQARIVLVNLLIHVSLKASALLYCHQHPQHRNRLILVNDRQAAEHRR